MFILQILLVQDGVCDGVQELGEPILSIPDAIKANSYYDPPSSCSFALCGQVHLGDPDAVLEASPHTIKGAR